MGSVGALSECLLLGLLFAFAHCSMIAPTTAESQVDERLAELKVDSSLQAKQSRKIKQMLNPPPNKRDEFTLDLDNNRAIAEANRKFVQDFFRKSLFAEITSLTSLADLPKQREMIRDKVCMVTGRNKETAAMDFVNGYTSSVMHAICNGILEATTTNGEQQSAIVIQQSVRNGDNELRLVRSVADFRAGDQIFDLAGDAIPQSEITKLEQSSKDFHPAVKLNAMLILGDLNDTQPRRNRPETAVPRKLTRQDLIAYLESPGQLSDVLLVGALTGMQRHAKDSLDSETKKRIGKVVVNIVNAATRSTRDPTVEIWARRQGIDILGQLALPNTEKFLLQILEDDKQPISIRVAAVDALRSLNLSVIASDTVGRFAKALAQLAADICQEERVAARTPLPSFSPDRLRVRLLALQTALLQDAGGGGSGLRAIAPAEKTAALDQLVDTLKQVEAQIRALTVASDRKQIDDVLQKSVQELRALTQTSAGAPPAAPPAAPQTAERR